MFHLKKIFLYSLRHPSFIRLSPRFPVTIRRPFSLLAHLSLEEKLRSTKISCSSCGLAFQISDSSLEGFIEPKILLKDPRFKQNYDEKLEMANEKPLYCERCHSIKANKTDIPEVSMEKSLKNLDLNTFLSSVYGEFKPNSLIIYIVDLSNFLASVIPQVFNLKEVKKCKVWIIVNKIDVLPSDFSLVAAKNYIRRFFKDRAEEIDIKTEEVFFVSSKTGEGFDKLISKLKPLQQKGAYRTAYIIGATNTGKSTFINKMLAKMKPHSSEIKYRKYEASSEDLATSQLPNTTLQTLFREIPGLKYHFYDTPGIPNEAILGSEMSELLRRNKNLVIAKKIKPERVELLPGFALFIGGLARIDFPMNQLSDVSKIVGHMYCAYDIALHRTASEKANEIYLKQYGKLLKPVFNDDIHKVAFKRHDIDLNFSEMGEGLDFIEIYGLGWLRFTRFSITKKPEVPIKLSLYLPETVKFSLRKTMLPTEKPSNPQRRLSEIKKRKLEKTQLISRKILH